MKYHCVQRFRHLLWLALLLLALPCSSYAQSATGVGFAQIKIHDPVNGGSMPGHVFYPSAPSTETTRVGPYDLHARRGAPAIPGAKPLVVISHGHGGSDLGHHDLAVYLASHGFIVATLQHPRDNYKDTSGNGTPAVLIGRPIQVKATISMLLDDAQWKALINPEKIGVAGFSAGGYTALVLVGAVPRFTRLIDFCKAHPDNKNVCTPFREMKAQLAGHGWTSAKQYLTNVQSQLQRWGDPDDPRVKAAFAMSPWSMVFDQAGLGSINRPVYLYDGADDQFQPIQYNTLHAAALIKTLVGIKLIPKAGHFVFLAPCPPEIMKSVAKICTDPPGVNRAIAHRRINADALSFFRGTLHVPPKGAGI
jgi:predicted dienelactone hydrolase